jgi:molybdopterin molybdotransferase
MLTLDDARRQLLDRVSPAEGEAIALADAAGRVLVEPRVIARVDVPPFANSAMDGYAIRAADAPGPLTLTGEIAAGAAELPAVTAGTAVRIMTGAPMPPGADSVVPLEEAVEAVEGVTVPGSVQPGAHVRAAAHDTRAGDEICLPGALTPAGIAVLASLGIGSVDVRRRPVVAVLSTGDELAGPGQALRPGQIHDANSPALAAAVVEAGGQPLTLARAGDERGAIERALADAAARADLVVTSGGVSVGRHDHVREVLEERGQLGFWRIAVQPGKPLAVGELDTTTVIGLPGNPVSALVTFELFVRPFIRAALGLIGDGRLHLRARPEARIEKDAARRAFLRVVVRQDGTELRARAAGGQASSQLRPMADANALLVVPEGPDGAEPDRSYEVIMLGPVAEGS